MKEKLTLKQIRNYWKTQALEHGQSPTASWSDERVIELEIGNIAEYLDDGDCVLDVGCANGFSTVQFALRKKIKIRGLDYVSEMIDQAILRIRDLKDLAGRVEFAVGDITSLQESTASYDKLVVIRVIINLKDWLSQLKALRECARVLKPGGRLLLSEATLQGWSRLNEFRREWGLPDIPMPAFNRYLDQDLVAESMASELRLDRIVDFASTYYVGTRVLKPLLIQALGTKIDAADPNMEWNRWLAQLPSWGDYGTQKLFVFTKR